MSLQRYPTNLYIAYRLTSSFLLWPIENLNSISALNGRKIFSNTGTGRVLIVWFVLGNLQFILVLSYTVNDKLMNSHKFSTDVQQ